MVINSKDLLRLEGPSVDEALEEREVFLKKAIQFLVYLLALLFFIPILLFIYPKEPRRRRWIFLEIIEEEKIPEKGIKTVSFSYRRRGREVAMTVFLRREGRSIKALSPYCTHLGCRVVFRRREEIFVCPCHGGRYDLRGKNIGGPPPRPLTSLPVKLKGDKVLVGIRV